LSFFCVRAIINWSCSKVVVISWDWIPWISFRIWSIWLFFRVVDIDIGNSCVCVWSAVKVWIHIFLEVGQTVVFISDCWRFKKLVESLVWVVDVSRWNVSRVTEVNNFWFEFSVWIFFRWAVIVISNDIKDCNASWFVIRWEIINVIIKLAVCIIARISWWNLISIAVVNVISVDSINWVDICWTVICPNDSCCGSNSSWRISWCWWWGIIPGITFRIIAIAWRNGSAEIRAVVCFN